MNSLPLQLMDFHLEKVIYQMSNGAYRYDVKVENSGSDDTIRIMTLTSMARSAAGSDSITTLSTQTMPNRPGGDGGSCETANMLYW